jgi:hypothetical protein
VVGLFWWDENQDSRYRQLEGREGLFERVWEAPRQLPTENHDN